MTPGEFRATIEVAPVYKMSLGKSGKHEKEALESGCLLFHTEKQFYQAVVSGDEHRIKQAGSRLLSNDHLSGNSPNAAVNIWRKTIEDFNQLPEGILILHWEAKLGHLYWGVTQGKPEWVRDEPNDWGQDALLFRRPLNGGWQKQSVGGVSLSNLHPRARALAINQATLGPVVTDTGFFRALLTDKDIADWTSRQDWIAKAKQTGWVAKDVSARIAERREKLLQDPLITETADYFEGEIKRMAETALKTVANANGQTVLVTIKIKESGLGRFELEQEIAALLNSQDYRCALTGFKFVKNQTNLHLRTSLDRKDSSLGYVPGNLQVVTRAANFYKSASDVDDWKMKTSAMEKMAIAMQKARKEIGALAVETAKP